MPGLQVVKTLEINSSNVTSTSLTEDDYPVYSNATAYTEGDRVIYLSKVYEAVSTEGNTGKMPTGEPAYWQEVGPTNKWKAFDLSSTTRTRFDTSAYYEIYPGQGISNVVFLSLDAVTQLRVRLTDPDWGVVYDHTEQINSIPTSADWYTWTFEVRVARTECVLADLPAYPSATLRIDMDGSSDAGVGVIAIGQQREIGTAVQYGARLGIQDFSRKERSDYGETYLVQRAYAKEMSLTVEVPNADLDNTYSLLAGLRATPCLWNASDRWRATTLWGFYRSFEITISYFDTSELSLELEGLV